MCHIIFLMSLQWFGFNEIYARRNVERVLLYWASMLLKSITGVTNKCMDMKNQLPGIVRLHLFSLMMYVNINFYFFWNLRVTYNSCRRQCGTYCEKCLRGYLRSSPWVTLQYFGKDHLGTLFVLALRDKQGSGIIDGSFLVNLGLEFLTYTKSHPKLQMSITCRSGRKDER